MHNLGDRVAAHIATELTNDATTQSSLSLAPALWSPAVVVSTPTTAAALCAALVALLRAGSRPTQGSSAILPGRAGTQTMPEHTSLHASSSNTVHALHGEAGVPASIPGAGSGAGPGSVPAPTGSTAATAVVAALAGMQPTARTCSTLDHLVGLLEERPALPLAQRTTAAAAALHIAACACAGDVAAEQSAQEAETSARVALQEQRYREGLDPSDGVRSAQHDRQVLRELHGALISHAQDALTTPPTGLGTGEDVSANRDLTDTATRAVLQANAAAFFKGTSACRTVPKVLMQQLGARLDPAAGDTPGARQAGLQAVVRLVFMPHAAVERAVMLLGSSVERERQCAMVALLEFLEAGDLLDDSAFSPLERVLRDFFASVVASLLVTDRRTPALASFASSAESTLVGAVRVRVRVRAGGRLKGECECLG